jgi:hypothetical protein
LGKAQSSARENDARIGRTLKQFARETFRKTCHAFVGRLWECVGLLAPLCFDANINEIKQLFDLA